MIIKKSTFLYLLLISLFAGSLIYLKIASLYHFVAIILSLVFFAFDGKTIVKIYKTNYFIRFFVLWFMYALFSIFWSEDSVLTLQYTYYIFLILAVVYIFTLVITTEDIVYSIIKFLIVGSTIVSVISLWESLTGNHLLADYLNTPARERILKYFPSFSFANPNDFAMFMYVLVPYNIFGIMHIKKNLYTSLSMFNVLSSLYLIAATQSRTILIVYSLFIFIIVLTNFKKSILPLVIGVAVMMVILSFTVDMNTVVNDALYSIEGSELSNSLTSYGGSGRVRINLFLNCVLIAIFSFGIGVGAGCHRIVMPLYSYNYFPTGHIRVAHNFIGEFLADYGIILFVKFVIEYVKAMKILKSSQTFFGTTWFSDFGKLLFWWMLLFPLAAITSSSLVQITSLWINFAIVASFINITNNKKSEVSLNNIEE